MLSLEKCLGISEKGRGKTELQEGKLTRNITRKLQRLQRQSLREREKKRERERERWRNRHSWTDTPQLFSSFVSSCGEDYSLLYDDCCLSFIFLGYLWGPGETDEFYIWWMGVLMLFKSLVFSVSHSVSFNLSLSCPFWSVIPIQGVRSSELSLVSTVFSSLFCWWDLEEHCDPLNIKSILN